MRGRLVQQRHRFRAAPRARERADHDRVGLVDSRGGRHLAEERVRERDCLRGPLVAGRVDHRLVREEGRDASS